MFITGLHPQDRHFQILLVVYTATNLTTFCVLHL